MLDERKVKLMTKLALYEETHGKEDFKISSYYRKDYASLHVIYAFLCMSGRRVVTCRRGEYYG